MALNANLPNSESERHNSRYSLRDRRHIHGYKHKDSSGRDCDCQVTRDKDVVTRKCHNLTATEDSIQRENGRTIENSSTCDKIEDVKTYERRRTELTDVENGNAKHGKQGEARKDEHSKEEKVERQRRPLALGRSEKVYVPPQKFSQGKEYVEDKSSEEYQLLTWVELRRSIIELVKKARKKANESNLKNILPELFSQNLIRGHGVFACSESQWESPTSTHEFAALVAVVNSKFPEIGKLLLKRVVLELWSVYTLNWTREEKPKLSAILKFVAHLVNQRVADEVIALDLLALLLTMPSEDDIEMAVDFVKECGAALLHLSPRSLHATLEQLRDVLDDKAVDERVQLKIENLLALRKANFEACEGVLPELDLVEEEDHFPHVLTLDDVVDGGLDYDKSLDSFI